MKVIIINDDDGHAHAVEFTDENMRKCLQHLIDIRYDMLEPEGREQLVRIGSAEEIKAFIQKYNGPMGRSCGGKMHVVEVQAEWDFGYGPWG